MQGMQLNTVQPICQPSPTREKKREVVADILTANSKNSAHRFLPFMARYVILPLSRRLLSVFLPTTSAPATFVVCRVREDKYAQSFMTLTQIVQIKFRVRISLSCKKNFVLCLVEFSNQGQIQDSNNFLTWCQNPCHQNQSSKF